MSQKKLKGQIAVVTGSSRGIGKGVALELGAAGATVAVLDDPAAAGTLALAAVQPDGAVNLQPGSKPPDPEDRVIGLVDRSA